MVDVLLRVDDRSAGAWVVEWEAQTAVVIL